MADPGRCVRTPSKGGLPSWFAAVRPLKRPCTGSAPRDQSSPRARGASSVNVALPDAMRVPWPPLWCGGPFSLVRDAVWGGQAGV